MTKTIYKVWGSLETQTGSLDFRGDTWEDLKEFAGFCELQGATESHEKLTIIPISFQNPVVADFFERMMKIWEAETSDLDDMLSFCEAASLASYVGQVGSRAWLDMCSEE